MVNLTAFAPEHVAQMRVNQEAEETLLRLSNLGGVLEAWAMHPSYTLWGPAGPLICMGMVLPWPGLGEVWAVFAEEAQRHYWQIRKYARACIDLLTVKYSLRRVHGSARKRAPLARRFFRALGMWQTCVWPLAGPQGETLVWYVRYYWG